MEIVSIIITLIAIIATVVFGYFQIIVPFIKKEVRLSKKFPFVESTDIPVKRGRKKKKKSGRRWLMPITAVTVVVIAIILIRVLFLQAAELPPKPIAIMTFDNLTGDESYDYLCKAIPNLLITNLEQSDRLQVMTWERMHDLLKQLDKEDLAVIDEETGFELCRMDDINIIVLGSFTKTGDVFVTDIKILDVSSKKLLKTTSSKGKGIASILKVQVDDLSRDIAKHVDLFERTVVPTTMQIMEVTTTSMAAYNYFLRGREESEKLYHDDARKFLEKAIEIDSTFAFAHFILAWTNEKLKDYAASTHALENAMAFADRTTDKERLYIEAFYEEDLEKRFRIFAQLARKYPKEKWVHVLLGNYYTVKKLFYRALEEYNKTLELDPTHGGALYCIAYRYMEMGDYAKANEYLKRYATASPGDANPFDCLGDLFYHMGQLDKALEQYKEALFVKPDFYASSGKIAYIYALREEYAEAMKWVDTYITTASSSGVRAHGYLQKAYYSYLRGNFNQTLYILDTVDDSLEQTGYEGLMELGNRLRTLIHYDQGMLEPSRNCLNNCYANLTEDSYNTICFNFFLGLIELKQEELDSAKTRLALIKSLIPDILPYSKNQELFIYIPYKEQALFFREYLYAEVLLSQDSLEKAISIGKEILDVSIDVNRYDLYYHMVFFKDIVARIYRIQGDTDRAILEYERLTDPDPDKRGRCLILPAWHYALAKLYQEKGLKTKAIEQYEKFLDIWKNADADRPEKIDAKKRLGKLKMEG